MLVFNSIMERPALYSEANTVYLETYNEASFRSRGIQDCFKLACWTFQLTCFYFLKYGCSASHLAIVIT